MKLIKKLGTRLDKNGYKRSWAEFYCEFCKQIVEKKLNDGKEAKSCGCSKGELIAKSKMGKKRKPFTKEHKEGMSKSKIGKKRKPFMEEHKQKISKTRKQNGLSKGKNNPMYNIRKYGEENPNWSGGRSFEPYSPDFNKEKKQQVLERDNYTCQCPNCDHLSVILCIHHIDYDKQNNSLENLITLCDFCHNKTNGKNKRHYFTEFYQIIMRTKIMECLL